MGAGRITQHRKTNGDSVLKCFSQVFAVINESAYNSLLAWYLWLCFLAKRLIHMKLNSLSYIAALFLREFWPGILRWQL